MSNRIAVVLGTRPEMIKLAPVIHRLGERALVVHTGQHFDANMSQSFLDQLHIGRPHLLLEVGGNTRGAQIGRATEAIETFLVNERPAAVIVQGDTNSGDPEQARNHSHRAEYLERAAGFGADSPAAEKRRDAG